MLNPNAARHLRGGSTGVQPPLTLPAGTSFPAACEETMPGYPQTPVGPMSLEEGPQQPDWGWRHHRRQRQRPTGRRLQSCPPFSAPLPPPPPREDPTVRVVLPLHPFVLMSTAPAPMLHSFHNAPNAAAYHVSLSMSNQAMLHLWREYQRGGTLSCLIDPRS